MSYQPVSNGGATANDSSDAEMKGYDSRNRLPSDGIPRIDVSLWDHTGRLAVAWSILFFTSAGIPNLFYFALRYGGNLSLGTALAVCTAIFGVVTVLSLGSRTFKLLRPTSDCRPLGASRIAMDYFNWNYIGGFVAITAIITVGNVIKNVRVSAMGLSLLLVDVCGQLLIVGLMQAAGMRTPFRMSSVDKGEPMRGGAYAIAEDIVAVDGGQGQHYRRQLRDRYLASPQIRALCLRLDLLWGTTGLAAAALTIGLVFGVNEPNVGFILGWVLPWAYAAIMAFVSIRMTAAAVKKERSGPVIQG